MGDLSTGAVGVGEEGALDMDMDFDFDAELLQLRGSVSVSGSVLETSLSPDDDVLVDLEQDLEQELYLDQELYSGSESLLADGVLATIDIGECTARNTALSQVYVEYTASIRLTYGMLTY